MAVTINGYNIVTNKPIIYFYNEDEERDDYLNGSHSGTRGVEIDYRLKTHDGYITCNYSFYTTDSKKIIPNYEVPYNHTVMLAFPAHMASVVGCVNISKKINLYSALLFKGPRYGITGYDDVNGKTFYQKFEPVYTFNLMLNLRNVFIKNISLSAGVKNLFNANDNIIQPYNGLHAPLPGPSRQYVLKLSYNIPFK